ncbi:MAG: helix-turn-helix transcriptional regulator [Bacteroidales bacterium]
MDLAKLNIEEGTKLPQFDLPIDFIVSDQINAQLLRFYGEFPCKIDACIIAYCIKGSLKASVNLWEYTIKTGDLVVLIPGSFIQIYEVSDDIQVSFVGYSSSFLKEVNFWKLASNMLIPIYKSPVITPTVELSEIYKSLFELLTKSSYVSTSLLSKNIIRSVLSIFIDSIDQAFEQKLVEQANTPTTREQKILSEFLQLAFENYRYEHKVGFYAQNANLTLSHFCNVISKATNMTPQEILMNMIILDAKALLKGTDYTVNKISQTLGFTTQTTFNRYFRTYTNMTPQEYRNS